MFIHFLYIKGWLEMPSSNLMSIQIASRCCLVFEIAELLLYLVQKIHISVTESIPALT